LTAQAKRFGCLLLVVAGGAEHFDDHLPFQIVDWQKTRRRIHAISEQRETREEKNGQLWLS
jgi:hypothetical protein